ncbi:MAG: hypothetical protein ACLQB1_03150 [Streptosporangiaceae bacterium]
MRAHHQALRQDGAGTDVDLTEDHRGSGDLRLGLVNEKVIETHAPLPSSWPFGHPADRYRLYARTTRAGASLELPAFSALDELAATIRAEVNAGILRVSSPGWARSHGSGCAGC